jgi:hypothetical protein
VLRLKVPDTDNSHVEPNVTWLVLLMDMPPESTRRALPDPDPVIVADVIAIDPPVRRTVLLSPANIMDADCSARSSFRVADNRAPVLHTPLVDKDTPFSETNPQSDPPKSSARPLSPVDFEM